MAAWVEQPPDRRPGRWARIALVAIGLGLALVYYTAAKLHPYDDTGEPLRMETHRQLGMPPCKFVELTGKPCPSCGLTSSYALLLHGDLGASLRANWVGTLMAGGGMLAVPWFLFAGVRGRTPWVRSVEKTLYWIIFGVAVLLLGRWGFVLLLDWLSKVSW